MQLKMKKMGQRMMVLVGGVLLSACASMKSGESVSYAVWNESRSSTIYSPQLVALDESRKILSGGDPGAIHQPLPKKGTGWIGLGGVSIPRDVGHRVPERARLTWRLPAKPGQEEWSGDLVGPFNVEIRSRIPEHVLKRVKGSREAKLAIGVSAGVQPIKMRWVLQELFFVNGSPVGGWRDKERGGDW